MRIRAALVITIALFGCFRDTPANGPEEGNPHAAQPIARVRIIDLEGSPLASMIPIATRQPNAFDAPVARGAATGDDGKSWFELPEGERLFVRAWDPGFVYFASNYFEVLPSAEGATPELEVIMAKGAELEMRLITSVGEAIGGTQVELMMEHPTRGPWWPDRGVTDSRGDVNFRTLPAGRYVLHVRVIGLGSVDVPEVSLKPGGRASLGAIVIEPDPQ